MNVKGKSSKEKLEDIVYFRHGKNPSYEEWKRAYMKLYEYDDEPDYTEFEILRGDWDYTR